MRLQPIAQRQKAADHRRELARLPPRIGHGRALGAVKHSILCACWHMLKNGELYRDLGGDYFRKRDPERQTKRLVAQLERLGHKVTLEALPEAASSALCKRLASRWRSLICALRYRVS